MRLPPSEAYVAYHRALVARLAAVDLWSGDTASPYTAFAPGADMDPDRVLHGPTGEVVFRSIDDMQVHVVCVALNALAAARAALGPEPPYS